MPNTNTSLTRQELFDLVWTKPATHIAKEFEIQTATLLKACKLLNVPRPTTGHWVKAEHGHVPTRPALPPPAQGTPASTTFAELVSKHRVKPKEELPAIVPAAVEAEST